MYNFENSKQKYAPDTLKNKLEKLSSYLQVFVRKVKGYLNLINLQSVSGKLCIKYLPEELNLMRQNKEASSITGTNHKSELKIKRESLRRIRADYTLHTYTYSVGTHSV